MVNVSNVKGEDFAKSVLRRQQTQLQATQVSFTDLYIRRLKHHLTRAAPLQQSPAVDPNLNPVAGPSGK